MQKHTHFNTHLRELLEAAAFLSDYLIPDNILQKFIGRRTIFCTMGKSAFACKKVVYSARSFGLNWHDIDVFHAFHGDAGLIKGGDLLIFVSKSGETKETLKMAKHFCDWDTISMCSGQSSSLTKLCKDTIFIPIEKEGSPFQLAPMISTTLYMAVLHAILCEVIHMEGISFSDFAKNHSDGHIGTQIKGTNHV